MALYIVVYRVEAKQGMLARDRERERERETDREREREKERGRKRGQAGDVGER